LRRSQEDLYGMMVKLDERQKTIFNTLIRVEKHLEKLNGKVAEHETDIAKMQVWGSVAVVTFPLIVNIIMRFV
tara:strand:+ start:1386 stop:1604 length:219 start_codon:yes stop_codon:yes gene_type:complete